MFTYLTEDQHTFFYEQGYLLIKNLYSKDNIDQVRLIIETGLKNGKWKEAFYNTENITTHIYNLFPELVDLIFTENYIKIMKDLLGENCSMIVEPAIHRNAYGGWHKDSSFLSIQGETFHLNKDFCCAQTAIYLQDNDKDYGGGLTIIPETQNTPNKFTHLYEMNMANRILLKIQKALNISIFDKLDSNENLIDIPSKAGDLIVFNYSIDHKGTPALKKDIRGDKLVMFNAFVNSADYAKRQNTCLKKIKSGYSQVYLAQNLALPTDLIAKGEALDIEVLF